MLVLKVVPVVTNTRTFKAARYWVAVAVGNRDGQIGIGEHVGKTEVIATKKAEKKAFKILKLRLFENRTVKGRVTGLSGGDCLLLSQAPKGVGIIKTSGMGRKILELAGIKDCFIANCWDNLTRVRAFAKAFSKLFRPARS